MTQEKYIAFVKEVQRLASFWDAIASSTATTAVARKRCPDAKETMEDASLYYARMDSAHKLCDEVIEYARGYLLET